MTTDEQHTSEIIDIISAICDIDSETMVKLTSELHNVVKQHIINDKKMIDELISTMSSVCELDSDYKKMLELAFRKCVKKQTTKILAAMSDDEKKPTLSDVRLIDGTCTNNMVITEDDYVYGSIDLVLPSMTICLTPSNPDTILYKGYDFDPDGDDKFCSTRCNGEFNLEWEEGIIDITVDKDECGGCIDLRMEVTSGLMSQFRAALRKWRDIVHECEEAKAKPVAPGKATTCLE